MNPNFGNYTFYFKSPQNIVFNSFLLSSEVLKACMAESGMKFDEKEVFNLAKALYDDSVKVIFVVIIVVTPSIITSKNL